jgi:flagella basal body P-ring formation protein FlgA
MTRLPASNPHGRLAKIAATGLTAWFFLAGVAQAGQVVSLRSQIVDPNGQVTLGELFVGAGAAANVQVADRIGSSVVLDAAAVQRLARQAGLDWANPNGLRRIIVRGPSEAPEHNVQVLTYAHSLGAGDVVQPGDLVWSKAAGAPTDAPRNADAVIGMAARRPLREGDAVALRDISAPVVIKSGDVISVVYEDGGIRLTLQAKAMANASVGDSLNVQNTASKKVIEAVATGPDEAAVGPEAARLKAARPTSQYALR